MDTQQEQLERSLWLQKIKMRRLVDITQAINNSAKVEDIFKIYHDLLSWVLRIERFVLVYRDAQQWVVGLSHGVEDSSPALDPAILAELELHHKYTKTDQLEQPFLHQFDLLVPIQHKTQPLAFLLLGGEHFCETLINDFEEIQLLAAIANVIIVAIENKRLFKRQLEQSQMKKELELAKQVQNMLIPSELPNSILYEFAGIYQPHEGVGGDYYDFIELADKEVAFCIADIAGKGMPAALIMANFQATLHSLVHRKYLKVHKFIELLNQRVLKTTRGDRFITLFIARYDPKSRRLLYVCAGHPPPYLYSDSKGLQQLTEGCTFLGQFKEIKDISYGSLVLEEDSLFFLYTDGLSELQLMGQQERDTSWIEQFLLEHKHLDVKSLNAALLTHLEQRKGQYGYHDDISILTGRIKVPQDQYHHI